MNHLISKWGLFISKKDEVTVLPLVTKAFSLPTIHDYIPVECALETPYSTHVATLWNCPTI